MIPLRDREPQAHFAHSPYGRRKGIYGNTQNIVNTSIKSALQKLGECQCGGQFSGGGKQTEKTFGTMETEKDILEKKDSAELLLRYERARAMRGQRGTDLYNAAKLLRKYTDKPKEEIIKSGTAKEMAALFLCDKDVRGHLIHKRNLSTLEELTMRNRLEREAELNEEFSHYFVEYLRLREYGKMVREIALYFKMEAASLVALMREWELYDTQAEAYTKFLQVGREIAKVEKVEEEAAEWAVRTGKYIEENSVFSRARFVFDEASCSLRTDITGKGMLYERIQSTSREAAIHLASVKSALQVAEEWLQETNTFYLPICILEAQEEIESEKWLLKQDPDRSHYRSEINYRRLRGKVVTAEQEERAVYPDFCELEPDKLVYENHKEGLPTIKVT